MYSAWFAFLHHLAAFTAVGALAVEAAAFRPPLSAAQALRLQRTDNLYGVAAVAVLVIGLLRVVYFEKGAAYYWHDLFFLGKFTAFLLAALISVYPTRVFMSWKPVLRSGGTPQIPARVAQRVQVCLALELGAISVILLCAAFMARGFGYR